MSRRILITGSSRGIGRAIAIYLAAKNYEVIVNYKSNLKAAEEVLKVITDAGGKAQILKFDISNRAECRSTIKGDIDKHGVYYGVVCNASITMDNPFSLVTEEEWDGVINTNLNGFYNVLYPITKLMVKKKEGGRIITISSIAGIIGSSAGQVNYSASKAGIIGATKALALELARRRITVNCIAPGFIETDMTADLPEEVVKNIVPMRRMGQPDEIASLVNFLISDEASYITRQVISVNGGVI